MKKHITYLIILISALPAFAQTGAEQKIAYLDKEYDIVIDPRTAVYYRTRQIADNGYIVRHYFTSGKIEMEAACSELAPLIYDGTVKHYYENGNLREEGTYKKNRRVGTFTYFYDNGKPERQMDYGDGGKFRYLQYHTPSGIELLANGRGTLKDTDDAGDTIYSIVDNYQIVSCHKIGPQGTKIPLAVEQQASFPGGMDALLEYLRSHVTYPVAAWKQGIEGTVFVSFVVNKTGELSDVDIVRGISEECDAEAVRVVESFPNWEPAIERGKPVKSRFVLPLKFRLATKGRR